MSPTVLAVGAATFAVALVVAVAAPWRPWTRARACATGPIRSTAEAPAIGRSPTAGDAPATGRSAESIAVGASVRSPEPSVGPATGRSPPSGRGRLTTVVVAVVMGTAFGPLGAAAAVVAAAAAPVLRGRRAHRRQAAAVEDELPEVVDLLALAVGAGLTVGHAVRAVARTVPGHLASHLARVVAEVDRGRRLADALDDLPARAGEATRPLVATLGACERYGAPVADALAHLAVEARERHRRRAEQAARRLPVLLLFPLVLCILPAFALLAVAPLIADAVQALRP